MNYKNITLSLLIYIPSLLSMHKKIIKYSGPTVAVGALSKHVYDQKQELNHYYENKELLYVPTLETCKPINLIPLKEYSLNESESAPTYNHLIALHHATWPDTSKNEHLDNKTNDILTKYYPEGPWQLPQRTKAELSSAIKLIISNEIDSSETHYSVYHGTYHTPGILFRTIMHQKTNSNIPNNYLALRDPHTQNPFGSNDDLLTLLTNERTKRKKQLWEKYHTKMRTKSTDPDYMTHVAGKVVGLSSSRYGGDILYEIATVGLPLEYNEALLSVNRAALAHSSPKAIKGSNSLRFLTRIQAENSIDDVLLNPYISIDARSHIDEMKKTVQSYGANPNIVDKHIDKLKPLCTNIGGSLIQIQIPKNISTKIMNCESYNNPKSYAQKKLEEMQAPLQETSINAIDYGHMIIPIPSILNTPTNGVTMHTIINAQQKDLTNFIQICHNISEEIINNQNQ
ncbi:MAG TPA: hypothetical protein VHX42_04965 [Candidatus Babeliales bacterium]|jgi:hypothetical protein|nr:hypothetical protein [Candidatus Babeliales bacterium]